MQRGGAEGRGEMGEAAASQGHWELGQAGRDSSLRICMETDTANMLILDLWPPET